MERINIVGSSGSGKSYFSKRLAEKLNVPHIEMDAVFWGKNWYWPPDEEFFPKMENALNADKWVLDGNYNRTVPIKWKNVTTVIWIDLPFFAPVFQATKRALIRAITREELWPGTGNRESFKESFFSKKSIILWSITNHAKVRKKYEKYMNDPKFSHIKFVAGHLIKK